jgi:UDP-N-acetyl-D-glucosamine dehydrogenase
MPRVVASLVGDVLNERGQSLKGSTILILGVSYKRDVNDARESPAIEIFHELTKRGATVRYHDPYVPELLVGGHSFRSVPLEDASLSGADCVVIVTDHSGIDYKRVVDLAKVVVDTRNATRSVVQHQDKIVKL